MSNPPSNPEPAPISDAPATPKNVTGPKVSQRRAFVPRIPGDHAPSMDEWLLSYSDMVTLLLTMFVALLLNARFDGSKPGIEGGGFGPGSGRMIERLFSRPVTSPYDDELDYPITSVQGTVSLAAPGRGAAVAIVKDEDLERIRRREEALARVRSRLHAANLNEFINASIEGDGIRLNIPNSILFNTGEANLQGRGPDVLRALAPILSADRFIVSVEGHTDNAPIKTDRFPSNWELSAQRAATVVRALAEDGLDPPRLQAVGYGDSRPLANNATEDGRRENRRVTLFLRNPN